MGLVLLMAGPMAVGQEPNEEEEDLRVLMQQMEAYQTQVSTAGLSDGGPQHPTPKERALEAALAEMQHRAVVAEEALASCRSEAASLKAGQ